MTYKERLAAITASQDPHLTLTNLISFYAELDATADEIKAATAEIKATIAATLAALQATSYRTPHGAATVIVPTEPTITYSASALDKFIIANPEYGRMLKPYRRETLKAPYLTIRLNTEAAT